MKFSNAKAGLTLILVAGAAVIIFLQYQTRQKLLAENDSLRQQIAQLKSNNQDVPVANPQPATNDELNELLRLRGEVGVLRAQTNQLAKLQTQNQQLREAFTNLAQQKQQETDPPSAAQQKEFGILELNTSRQYVLGMINYASEHQGLFPTNFEQMNSYFRNSEILTNMNRFEMVYTGPYSNIANPSSAIVVREIQPYLSNGKWLRTYSFADGHSELHRADSSDGFDEWEQQHVPVLKNQ